MNEYHCSLRCWVCGETIPIVTNGPPQFAFELAQLAESVGWIGVIDMNRNRALVFCSEVCRDAAKTKKGVYRARPPRRDHGK